MEHKAANLLAISPFRRRDRPTRPLVQRKAVAKGGATDSFSGVLRCRAMGEEKDETRWDVRVCVDKQGGRRGWRERASGDTILWGAPLLLRLFRRRHLSSAVPFGPSLSLSRSVGLSFGRSPLEGITAHSRSERERRTKRRLDSCRVPFVRFSSSPSNGLPGRRKF